MNLKASLSFLAVIAAFGAGYLLGGRQAAPEKIQLSCTPSAPEIIAGSTDLPVVLFWGNSLLHDHHWRIDGAVSVNCAMQGLTAAAAAPVIPSLPDVDPDVVVLAFGSVELVRAGKGDAFSGEVFAKAVAANISAMNVRWPRVRVVLTSAPSFSELGADEQRDLAEAAALNSVLSRIADEDDSLSYFEMSALYETGSPQLPGEATYDGVHLTQGAYQLWQAALNRHLSTLR